MTASSDDQSSGNSQGTPEPGEGEPRADRRLFHSIALRNLLSFPPDNEPLELKSLNVLIGPNGSGKSNLLDAISLLRATATDIRSVLSRGGGVAEWIWKRNPHEAAVIDVTVSTLAVATSIRHLFAFRSDGTSYGIEDELIEFPKDPHGEGREKHLYLFNVGRPFIAAAKADGGTRDTAPINPASFKSNLSILAQRDDPENYPEISSLKDAYDQVRIYREWQVGRDALVRKPQRTDLRRDHLEEDFSNLGLFLNKLRRKPKAKEAILSHLQNLYEGLTDFDMEIVGGTVQVFFTEGDFTIPAARLSDGSLRYLCLLAILCDPDPPPLIGIEEPELGLHPDLLPKLADLLVEASTRCQLIVTTHSDILVDALSEQPESIVVCEKVEGRTSMRRLDAKELAPWLEKYRLGQLWMSGELGGDPLVTAKIFIEGGGDAKDLRSRCREGFAALLKKLGFAGTRMPRLVACGNRGAVYDRFQTAHENNSSAGYLAMLIDSEDPLQDIDATWRHLQTRDGWKKPAGAVDKQVLLMTTCMETWIVCDRATLSDHFGDRLQETALPPLVNMEERPRGAIQDALAHATRNCGNAYAKGKRSFELLGKLDPAALEPQLPSFRRVKRILSGQL